MDDPSLPASPEAGPTNRETVWGVDSKASLEALAADLSNDREVKQTADGVLHTRDESGFAIGFALAHATPAAVPTKGYNWYQTADRLNRRAPRHPAVQPIRIGHIVFLIKNDANKDKARAFYQQRLGFKSTDHSARVGDFMRVGGAGADHHSFLLMWIRQQPVKFDHVAFEVAGFDDVLAAGPFMEQRGWKGTWGPGRQSLGSHLFWHFDNPCGGEVEFFTDMDRFDDSWQSQFWPDQTPGADWLLGDPPAYGPPAGP
jgi:catechol 2,3-dioxygenase-like lactoylglutathione lyase family enzyme